MVTSDEAGVPERQLTARGRATRERIVAAAAELMAERGVASTTTQDVQKAAGGISPSQIYHYFSDKKSLVQAVIAYQAEAVLSFQTPLLSKLDSMEALEAWRDAIVDLQRERACVGGCPIGSLVGELADRDPLARAQIASSLARWEKAISDGIRAMQDRGDLDKRADPDHLALATLTALQGGLLMTQARRDTTALEAVLNVVIERIRCYATAWPPNPAETLRSDRY
ncbi:TetR/AcrR family transcriptional regulator [Streptomyces sp. NPDC008222]|uniref:TetR/AcrR family transcriptional regulator n=1 Tax=Streptomyces sp. NPDC008222 TaxID=3364820 RepID=UPI0036EB4EBD